MIKSINFINLINFTKFDALKFLNRDEIYDEIYHAINFKHERPNE